MSRDRLRALHPLDPDNPRATYVLEKASRLELCTRTGYRAFAAWFDDGAQPGLHVRGTVGTPSKQFRGRDANWVYLGREPDWAQVRAQVTAARDVARQRGGGRALAHSELYQPLEKAVKLLKERPPYLGAGGPRAKVLSGEVGVCAALATLAAERLVEHPTEAAACRRCAKAAVSAGAMSCKAPAAQALVLAVRTLMAEREATAVEFAIECDELVMRHEFEAAFRQHIGDAPPRYERMLWRGANAKKYPAFWLVQIGETEHGLLANLGGRWAWNVADRDNALATVPDELLAEAVRLANARAAE